MIEFAFALWFVPVPASELEGLGFLLCLCGFAVAVVLVRPSVVELDSFDLLFQWGSPRLSAWIPLLSIMLTIFRGVLNSGIGTNFDGAGFVRKSTTLGFIVSSVFPVFHRAESLGV